MDNSPYPALSKGALTTGSVRGASASCALAPLTVLNQYNAFSTKWLQLARSPATGLESGLEEYYTT